MERANDEKERRRAAELLAARVLELRSQSRKVHLIGHSHGGSIIWLALVSLRQRGIVVEETVASTATVGTPFLHYGLKRSRIGIGAVTLIASIAAVAAATLSIWNSQWQYAWRDARDIVRIWIALAAIPLVALTWNLISMTQALFQARRIRGTAAKAVATPSSAGCTFACGPRRMSRSLASAPSNRSRPPRRLPIEGIP